MKIVLKAIVQIGKNKTKQYQFEFDLMRLNLCFIWSPEQPSARCLQSVKTIWPNCERLENFLICFTIGALNNN